MGFLWERLKAINEVEVNGQPQDNDEGTDYTATEDNEQNQPPTQNQGGEQNDPPVNQPGGAQDDAQQNDPTPEGGDTPATPDVGGDDPTATGDEGEDTIDYTEEGGDDDAGGDDTPTDDNTGGDESSADDTPVDELKKQEEEMYANLSPEQLDIKHKELKNQYLAVFDTINSIIDRIGDASTSEDNIHVIEYVSNKLAELQKMLTDYMNSVYKTKSYIENLVNYNRFLAVLNGINKILEEMNKKED